MNVWQALFCNQYDELVRTGRDGNKARTNGLILSSVALTLNLFTIFSVYLYITKDDLEWLSNTFVIDGKTVGQIAGLIFVAAFYVVLKLTIGSKNNFQNMVSKFDELSQADKKHVNRTAIIYLFGSIIIFIASLFM